MHVLHRPVEPAPLFILRNRDEVYVVRHQGIGPNVHAVLCRGLFKYTNVDEAIRIVVKYWVSSNTTLADMMGVVGYNTSRWSWH